jgi:CRISPR-associated protein Csm5
MKLGHLENFQIELETQSPIFIGSGRMLTKKDYIFDKKNGIIHMVDFSRFINYLKKRSLLEAYEHYMLDPSQRNMIFFLSNHHVRMEDYCQFTAYSIHAGEVMYHEKFRGVSTFIKGPDGNPYIPGSSLKGVLRTAIAAKLIENGCFEGIVNGMEEAAQNFYDRTRYMSTESNKLSEEIFHKLDIPFSQEHNHEGNQESEARQDDDDNLSNNEILKDFMRGIQISDSQPISCERLTICGKYDIRPDGSEEVISTYRECLMPNTRVSFSLTLDHTILKEVGIDIEFIKHALKSFYKKQHESFKRYFSHLPDAIKNEDLDWSEKIPVILGGGSGYVSKTLIYPLVKDRERAVKLSGTILSKQFSGHAHERDLTRFKVSPHMFKATKFNNQYYEMGKCTISIKSVV